jgi:hypothetical protein
MRRISVSEIAGFAGLGLAPGADRPPHHDRRWHGRVGVGIAVQVDVIPGERAEFFGSRPGEDREDDVGDSTDYARDGAASGVREAPSTG